MRIIIAGKKGRMEERGDIYTCCLVMSGKWFYSAPI